MPKSKKLKNIAVLISGHGTNLQSIIDHIKAGKLKCNLAVVISNKEDAYGLKRAKKAGIPAIFIDHKDIPREEYEKRIIEILKKYKVDLVVLAGYMRILTPYFIRQYKNQIINIHPALLPSFPGTDGYGDTWKYGCKVGGCTIHFVDEGVDTGPIILQKVNPIKENDTLESFKKRGLKIEHQAFPEAIKLFCEGKLKIEGRRVKVRK
ncbi:MAG: phosphoribosylglycinamide formyltransferase [Candidatus Portnoybacteria bacterium CG10_big_fil_rev_8_21_14_0_10_38_18]|uniref:Phosphoribosylglycinamide formyltransferase n=1 Tax=Candidatus Portnoybacteria bacterium CG10_big_fil_rev_8_21_14_0_10_38_18 TaxID=1974813 RepID=A0A2M8KC79_9BACT|nr:MAG: phosphoribosylglycinamide formyltransferase [Candidatus Portnoybacteria bacterium CG10_big_fil_rev_8_21_14_0_10_38_18]